jgi:two-component system chemotaxis response regulator CheB
MKILIVDDSTVYRTQLKKILDQLEGFEVKATASNGKIALSRLDEHPDIELVILDIEMPEMDGLQTLKKIQTREIRPFVMMFSTKTRAGSEATLEALSLGASDFAAKPEQARNYEEGLEALRVVIEPKLKQFKQLKKTNQKAVSREKPKPSSTTEKNSKEKNTFKTSFPKKALDSFKPSIILIGSSTGGPGALEYIFKDLSGPLRCPILICQHMPPMFTKTLANRLEKIMNGIKCKEAENNTKVDKSTVLVAPGGYHLKIIGHKNEALCKLDQGPYLNSVRPAVDWLFQTAVPIFKEGCMAFILTGMGHDGRDGCRSVKEHHGGVMIQDKDSSIVYGMPAAVEEAGYYDRIGHLEQVKMQLWNMAKA